MKLQLSYGSNGPQQNCGHTVLDGKYAAPAPQHVRDDGAVCRLADIVFWLQLLQGLNCLQPPMSKEWNGLFESALLLQQLKREVCHKVHNSTSTVAAAAENHATCLQDARVNNARLLDQARLVVQSCSQPEEAPCPQRVVHQQDLRVKTCTADTEL